MVHRKASLIIQPGDSFFPIIKAIDSAQQSINITIFRMDDPIVQRALLEAHRRGVRVRALVAASPRGWEKQNRKLLKELRKAGIETNQPAADSPKARYHYKFLTVDEKLSLILTFNPTQENLHYTRDYGVSLYDEQVAAELNRLFEADWSDTEFIPAEDIPLVISPYNSREKIMALLSGATKSIHISDAKLRDHQVINLLMKKAAEGVDVRILGRDRYYGEDFTTMKFRQITRFKLHAKAIVVDCARAFIGSMNLRYENLDKRREVGIILDDERIVKGMEDVFTSDWEEKRKDSQTRTLVIERKAAPSVEEVKESFALISRRDAMGRYPLRQGDTPIGRADDNIVVVANRDASRYHACISVAEDRCTLTDLNSHNGTYLNGNQVKGDVEISAGDIVRIGEGAEFRFIKL